MSRASVPAVLGVQRKALEASTVFVLVLLIGTIALWLDHERYEIEIEQRVQAQLLRARDVLDFEVNERVAVLGATAAFVRATPNYTPVEFQTFAGELSRQLGGVRSVQVAPNFVVRDVYSLNASDHGAVGYNILGHPDRAASVRRMIESGRMVLHGPIDLVQGGKALIGRAPLYVGQGAEQKVFGQATVLIDWPQVTELLGHALMSGDKAMPLKWALVDLDTKTRIQGDETALRAGNAATLEIRFFDRHWQIVAAPQSGWPVFSRWAWVIVLASFWLAGLAAWFVQRVRQTQARADQASLAKSEFLARMSHEFRTPLNGILGMTTLAMRTTLSLQQQDYLQKVALSGQHLLQLVNDVLDFSKMEAGKMALDDTPFELRRVVGNAVWMVGPSCERKGLDLIHQIDADLPQWVRGDPLRLGQVLINLLSNAVKFTAEGQVSLRVEKRELDDHRALESHRVAVRFSVRDTGVGVAPSSVPRLFSHFEQADSSTTRLYGGTGLGLSISRNLAELMGGHVGYEPQPGGGSHFWLDVSLAVAQAPEAQGQAQSHADHATAWAPPRHFSPATAAALAGKCILVVDDNAINRQVTEELLQQEGFAVLTAVHGQDAIDCLVRQSVDMVLMDIQMPVMDGLEATRHIRETLRSAVPIVAMTADASAQDRARCLAAGMNEHLAKPLDWDALCAVLVSQLGPQGAQADTPPGEAETRLAPQEVFPAAPSPDALNSTAAIARLGGDEGLYNKVLVKFEQTQAQALVVLDELSCQGEPAAALRHVHTLKGLAASIGADALRDAAAALEAALRADGTPRVVQAAQREFTIQFERAMDAVRRHLASMAAPLKSATLNRG